MTKMAHWLRTTLSPAWMANAACGPENRPDDTTPDDWAPNVHATLDNPRVIRAKQVCGDCPVMDRCASDLWSDPHAIVAGLAPVERRRIDRREKRKVAA